MSKKVKVKKLFPLSPMQEGMLFHSLLDRESGAYFEQAMFTINGELDIEKFEKKF